MNSKSGNQSNEQTITFMRERRSVPAKFMGGPGPNNEELREILEIAARVPDHGKLAPWRFVHYSPAKCIDLGEKILCRAQHIASQEGRELNDDIAAIEQGRFLRAPIVIGVISRAAEHVKIPEWEQILSSGAVAMNMLIAANAYGYDAQWLTEWIAYDGELRTELGLKDGERVTGFIHMGTRKNPKSERDRPSLDSIFSTMDVL